MLDRHHSRRAFLRAALQAAKGSCIALTIPAVLSACDQANEARKQQAAFTNLTEAEALAFAAIAARIMPSDETPGAEEAGVIYFMDTVLTDAEQLAFLRDGLTGLRQAAESAFGTSDFHLLPPQSQDQLLRAIEDGEFFGTMRFLTIAGMFCLPEYGGNRDNVGYQIIGFEDRHAWVPPFGSYDAERGGNI